MNDMTISGHVPGPMLPEHAMAERAMIERLRLDHVIAPPELSPTPPATALRNPAESKPWLITIVDLTTLLLTFFVLLFSMSHVKPERYRALAQSYSEAFAPFGLAKPNQTLPAIPATAGDDLGYLQAVLKSAFAASPGLRDVAFRLTPQYLMLTLPATALFQADSGRFSDTAKTSVFDLSGVLSNLHNRIAVTGTAAVSAHDAGPAWALAMTRASAMADALARAGYDQPVTILGKGGAATDVDAALGRVEIMILPERPQS